MDFTRLLSPDNFDRPCLADDRNESWISYGLLSEKVTVWSQRLSGSKSVVFLYIENSIESVAILLAALNAGHAVALLDPSLPPASREQLNSLYQPEFTISSENGNEMTIKQQAHSTDVHPDLAILLSTSGSTGSPKFVRLKAGNTISNAQAITQAMQIECDDIACAHLPLHYSYGLSVLTSHLFAGAAVRLTKMGFTDREFWNGMKQARITHLSGVPFHFQMLERLQYDRIDLPELKSISQAGGFLDISKRERVYNYMHGRNGRFYVMYGQTEAAPRITTLTHDEFPEASGSVGCALQGGELRILDDDGNSVGVGEEGEVQYTGPNVMMGYSERREDLGKGDELNGTLMTGDIGLLDEAGRLTLTGRTKRSAKIYGLRVNLDEVEKFANKAASESNYEIAVTYKPEILVFHYEVKDGLPIPELEEVLKMNLAGHYTLPKSCYKFSAVQNIPRMSSGKINYRLLDKSI